MEENKKINTTRGEIKEVVQEVIMDALAGFNVNFLEPGLNRAKKELKKEIQDSRDYTDKRISELKADLVLPLRKENEKINEVKNILQEKKIFNTKDAARIDKIEVFPKVA